MTSSTDSTVNLARRIARARVPLGFVCAAVVVWLARPHATSLVLGGGIAICGEALRVWAAGHLEKSREVTTSGPYRYVRHPLYLGSTLMGVGLAVACASAGAATVIAAYLAISLGAAIRTEEAFLRGRFGTAYATYAAGARDATSARRWSRERVLRNREYRAMIGLIVAMALLWARSRG